MILPNVTEIKIKRKKANLTQKQLSQESNVSQSLIAKIESGKAEASYEKIRKIFSVLEKFSEKQEKTCSEVMSSKVAGIKDSDNVEKAAMLMHKQEVSQLPVFKGKLIVGSVSESTILHQLENQSKEELYKKKVHEIMEESFPLVSRDIPIKSIIPLLEKSSAILVSEKGGILGIITKADLI